MVLVAGLVLVANSVLVADLALVVDLVLVARVDLADFDEVLVRASTGRCSADKSRASG